MVTQVFKETLVQKVMRVPVPCLPKTNNYPRKKEVITSKIIYCLFRFGHKNWNEYPNRNKPEFKSENLDLFYWILNFSTKILKYLKFLLEYPKSQFLPENPYIYLKTREFIRNFIQRVFSCSENLYPNSTEPEPVFSIYPIGS